jgi:hypothetical protein
MNGTFGFLTIWGDNKVDVVSTAMAIEVSRYICREVTHGSWKLPKHILLCMALRHWFRSAEITTLLNRLGYSETYSLSLELLTNDQSYQSLNEI